ncbi:30S ribosomal protein S1 [Acholeplasma equirhinis]|uniref:S1 RNA-binding domain-containing protein n=1 Tax=Acholeplasma equirhinis TaxID=555393 RepID=UPI00197A96D4|nr:S1 RNA-binding domain-containing protein [Acholeplasma equirhinis]MBN3490562.1 30S ribosomal protein S1 [Acholeplasma equirhinis]
MSDFIYPEKGQIIEGEAFKVEKDVVYLDIKAPTEGVIYSQYFDNPQPADLRKVIKVGDKIRVKVTSVSERDDSLLILLSRLPLLADKKIEEIENAYEAKTPIKTTVKSVGDKGLVLDYDRIELFLPFTLLDFELKEKKEALVGTTLEVLIEEYKADKRRPKLIATRKPIYEAIRQKQQEERLADRQKELDSIQTGQILEGVVESFEAHAAFVKFGHVSGMLRISQVSHHRIDKIEDALQKGQTVKVKVIKKEGNRLDLSMKALMPTPYQAYLESHKIGDRVTGKIVSKLPFGVLVELARDVKGLLHKNEYSWNPKANFDAYLKIGDELEVAIISKDLKAEKIALSRKALEDNPWADLSVNVGQTLEVRVEKVSKDGIQVSYNSVDGFIPASEAHNDPKINIADHYQVGDMVQAKVIEFSKEGWVLKLSVKKLLNKLERDEFEKYLVDEKVEDITLGDLFEELGKNKKKS